MLDGVSEPSLLFGHQRPGLAPCTTQTVTITVPQILLSSRWLCQGPESIQEMNAHRYPRVVPYYVTPEPAGIILSLSDSLKHQTSA